MAKRVVTTQENDSRLRKISMGRVYFLPWPVCPLSHVFPSPDIFSTDAWIMWDSWQTFHWPDTLQSRINHTYGLFIFGKMVLRFFLIKYVWFIYFWQIGPKYDLISMYEQLRNSVPFFSSTHRTVNKSKTLISSMQQRCRHLAISGIFR